jgi:hypothetical protein
MFTIKRHLLPLLILALTTLLSYWNVQYMYFWHDDYTTLYQVQQGKLMWFPYHFISILTKALLPLFGLEPTGYMLISIVLYTTAAFLVYSLVYLILNNKLQSLLVTFIFTSGYLGQDEIKMPLGTGLASLLGLNTILFAFITLILYCRKKNTLLLVATYLLFFLTLEIAPFRYGGFVFAFILGDWILNTNKNIKSFLSRASIYLLIFAIQYKIHPTQLIFDYEIEADRSLIISWKSIFYSLSTFWNTIFPSEIYYELYHYFKRFGNTTLTSMLILPSLLFSSFMFTLYNLSERKKLMKKLVAFIGASLVTTFIVQSISQLSFDERILATSGIIIIILFLSLLYQRHLAYPQYALFSLVLFFSGVSLYLTGAIDSYINSYHRYMLPLSFIPVMFMFFFIPKNSKNNKCTWAILVIPITLLSLSRFLIGNHTQQTFVRQNAWHAYNILSQLRSSIPSITNASLIYIDPKSKDLNYVVGDVLRVGALPSEAVLAVHYKQPLHNITLAENLSEIPAIQKKKLIPSENIYTFRYDGKNLENTSHITRKLLLEDSSKMVFDKTIWKEDNKALTANFGKEVHSMLPIKASILLKQNRPSALPLQNLVVSWSYDSYGLFDNTSTEVTNKKPLSFIIPANGVYLESISILKTSLPENYSLDILTLEYEK